MPNIVGFQQSELTPLWKRPLSLIVASTAALFIVASSTPLIFSQWGDLSALYLYRQDTWLLLCNFAVLVVALLRLRQVTRAINFPVWFPYASALGICCFCLAGHRWILGGWDMSRDEQMAVFDSQIFATSRLVQQLPVLWQAHVDALNTTFMLPVSQPVAWVSGYLPMNAALRALVGYSADPTLTGPLMTALGLVFLWKCARLLWPANREAASVAALLYVASGQVVFAGMTAYAMSAHLALDLLWLWLFLENRPATDLGALAVAAVATGLHQPLFHPLFALPFLVGLVRDRAWRRVVLYGLGYATICVFWLAWPMLTHALVAGSNSQKQAAGTDYLTRLLITLMHDNPVRWADMSGNLLRFAAWQPLLLLPLAAAGLALAWRDRPTLALAFSFALPVVVMAVILPYQGHGFGYRYLHGVIGPAILLAVQGWRHLTRRDARLRPLLLRTTAVGLLLLLPLQALMSHAFYAPAARIDARIRASGADYVIIGAGDAMFAKDLVINRPDLSNRPIRLLGDKVDDALIAAVCRPEIRVAMPTGALFHEVDSYFMTVPSGAADARLARLSPTLLAAGCSVEQLGP